MRRRSSVPALLAVTIAAITGCVDVPDAIRAQFAGPGAQDRSNFRRGNHGAEPPPTPKASTPASAESDAAVAAPEADVDADADADADGGAA